MKKFKNIIYSLGTIAVCLLVLAPSSYASNCFTFSPFTAKVSQVNEACSLGDVRIGDTLEITMAYDLDAEDTGYNDITMGLMMTGTLRVGRVPTCPFSLNEVI